MVEKILNNTTPYRKLGLHVKARLTFLHLKAACYQAPPAG